MFFPPHEWGGIKGGVDCTANLSPNPSPRSGEGWVSLFSHSINSQADTPATEFESSVYRLLYSATEWSFIFVAQAVSLRASELTTRALQINGT